MANKARGAYDELYNELCAFASLEKHRAKLDGALQELQVAGLEDGDGLFDYLLFEKGLIHEYAKTASLSEDDARLLRQLEQSVLSAFEVTQDGIRDLVDDREYPIRVTGVSLFAARLVGGDDLLEERSLDGMRPEMIKATLLQSPNRALDIYKFVRAAHFNVPEETLLYQAIYAVLRDPADVFSELGYDVYEEEPGWFSLYREDEDVAEFEIKGNLLYIYCNSPVELEQLITHLPEADLRLIRKEVLTAEELIYLEDQ